MTNVLLVYPPLDNTIQGPIPESITAISGFPPLNLLYLAASVETLPDINIKIFDCRIDRLSYEALTIKIAEFSPSIVGISTNTFMLLDALEVAAIVKKNNPDTRVILGGIHPTIYPKETIHFENIDYVIRGEGEFAFRDLVRAIIKGEPAEAIPGVVSKKTSNPELVPPQTIEELDSLPPPAWHLVDVYRYTRERKPVAWVYTSRGCVGRCTFCYIPSNKRSFRSHSVEYVFREVAHLLKKYKLKEFYVADDCFTVNQKRVIEFCDKLVENSITARWAAVTRVDNVSEETLKTMAKAGCRNIYLGIETGDETIQKKIRKNLNLDKAKKIIAAAQKFGLNPHAYVMIGHPSETEREIQNTTDYVLSLKVSGIAGGAAIFQPFPHTTTYLEGLSSGLIKNDYWKEFAETPTKEFRFRFWNEVFTNEQLLAIQIKFNNRFFFRPIIIYRTFWEAIHTGRLFSKIKSLITYVRISLTSPANNSDRINPER
jgi:anaerobic magnesium-protoporphyrin IX monomethyl ester cyclase